MEEVWKSIEGFEGLYEISSLGRVKSLPKELPYRFGVRVTSERIMKPNKNECGYRIVGLMKDKKRHMHKVHRLVAMAFIPNTENKRCVNHKDGNKENNSVENLEWVTHKENMKHAVENDLWTSWNKGKHYHITKEFSEERRKRISEAMRGNRHHAMPHSEETKRKISETKKAKYRNKER